MHSSMRVLEQLGCVRKTCEMYVVGQTLVLAPQSHQGQRSARLGITLETIDMARKERYDFHSSELYEMHVSVHHRHERQKSLATLRGQSIPTSSGCLLRPRQRENVQGIHLSYLVHIGSLAADARATRFGKGPNRRHSTLLLMQCSFQPQQNVTSCSSSLITRQLLLPINTHSALTQIQYWSN